MSRNKYNVGDVIDDKIIIRILGGNPFYHLVECASCGRTKEMSTSSISRRVGTTHQACSQGYAKKYNKLYITWAGMVDRVTNKNNARYKDYGGRGLTHDFELFIDFIDYMLPRYLEIKDDYGSHDITLERIDNDIGYVKGNITWATQKEQHSNKRTTVEFMAYSPEGGIYRSNNAKEFAKEFKLDRSCINKVIRGERKNHKGWKFEKISGKCVETNERVTE